MEASFTGTPIDATNTEVSEVSIETDSDEDTKVGDKVSKTNKYSDDMEIGLE